MLRLITGGESHGPAVVAIVEGLPAGVGISMADIDRDMAKRRSDMGRGGRGRLETDWVEVLSGVRHGRTLGSPVSLLIRNQDFANWQEVMGIEAGGEDTARVTRPRPGHADLAGTLKYGQGDIRNVLERASARETAARVAAGAVVRSFLGTLGIAVASHTVRIGRVGLRRRGYDFAAVAAVFDTDPEVRCLDPATSTRMKALVGEARERKETLGGVVEVIARGVPVGLGSVMQYDRRLDGRVAQALMSIPSVKAVAIGSGLRGAAMPGSRFQDEIYYRKGRFARRSNNAGGIEGGMSNGEDIVCRVYLKPLATLGEPLASVDIATREPAPATVERSDTCVVPRAGVVAEAMLAIVIGDALLEKFGGDHIAETKRNLNAYLETLK